MTQEQVAVILKSNSKAIASNSDTVAVVTIPLAKND